MSSNVPSKCKICQLAVSEGNDTCLLHTPMLNEADYEEYELCVSNHIIRKNNNHLLSHLESNDGFSEVCPEEIKEFIFHGKKSGNAVEFFSTRADVVLSDIFIHKTREKSLLSLLRECKNNFSFDLCVFYDEIENIGVNPHLGGELARLSFNKCEFKSKVVIEEDLSFEGCALFEDCCFSSVVISGFESARNYPLFKGGRVDELIEFKESKLDDLVYPGCSLMVLGDIIIKSSSFSGLVDFDYSDPRSINLEDSAFSKGFTIKRKEGSKLLNSILFNNVRFDGVAEIHGFRTRRASFLNLDSAKLFAFEKIEVLEQVVFEYATFQGHATFRGTKFLGGLDLDRANFSGEANFLGVDADGGNIANTTRETYRLIKHSFDKIGNHLEANKFFAKEMDKYREEVSGNKSLPLWDRAVFHINKNVSDFGQNYLLSIGWLLLFMVGYFYTFVLHRHFRLIHAKPSCDVFDNGYDTVNCLASGMIPFKGFLTNGMELFSLVFYIIFAVLVWQTVVALKRHTRR